MALSDKINEKLNAPKLTKLDRILEQLDDEDREALLHHLADHNVSSRIIAEALTEEGYPIGESSIRLGRRKYSE